jgi:hypothetical protein
MTAAIDLVIFTIPGRENLLRRTVRDLPALTDGLVARVIVAVDGNVETAAVAPARPDLILMSPTRRGYIGSITDALRQVSSDLFLWIEDDWDLSRLKREELAAMIAAMRADERLIQIRWSKTAPLNPGARQLRDGVIESDVGFSANPNVSRTTLVRAAFDHLVNLPVGGRTLGVDGFENVLTDWCAEKALVCAVLDPGQTPAIGHEGELETTGREWHMTASIKEKPADYGYLGERPPAWRRAWMVVKLTGAVAKLALAQLFSDAHYDLAFRVATARREFKWKRPKA